MNHLFFYNSVYEEIYDSSYGIGFIFIDEDETEADYKDFDTITYPLAPAGFCKTKDVARA